LITDNLDEPLRWRKPRRVFVNSMSDQFHEALPDEAIDKVFAVMALCPQHTFMVLTKRPARMREYFMNPVELRSRWHDALLDPRVFRDSWGDPRRALLGNPSRAGVAEGIMKGWRSLILPHVQLGVSVEDQATADERIPLLLQTPAAVRFISYEPALGPVDFEPFLPRLISSPSGMSAAALESGAAYERIGGGLDWVIAGGESGPGARPANPQWFRDVRDQCQTAGVAYFHKQNGEWLDVLGDDDPRLSDSQRLQRSKTPLIVLENTTMVRVGKHAAGRLLDGRTWDEFPEVAR
jgi:protein gp37